MKTSGETQELVNLLVRAVELMEEVYARHPELIHDDHAQDYSDIITALHRHNTYYRANPKILQMAHDYTPVNLLSKMPMEKVRTKKTPNVKQDDKLENHRNAG